MKKLLLIFLLLLLNCSEENPPKNPCGCLVIEWAYVNVGVYEETSRTVVECTLTNISLAEAIAANPLESDVTEIKCTNQNE